METTGEVSPVAVGIAHGDGCYFGGAGGGIGAAVADFPAGLQGFQVGDAAFPPQGRTQVQQGRIHLVAGVHAVGHNAGADHFVFTAEIHHTRRVVQMPDGDVHPPLLQHGIKRRKALRLPFGPGQVGAVGGGKVGKQALRLHMGKGSDLGANVRILLRHLKADAAHAGVHSKMEFACKPQLRRCPGQGQAVLIPVDGGADILPDCLGEGTHRGMAQNQNGLTDPRLPQLQRLQNGADSKKGTVIIQVLRQLHCPVTVGIGLDDGHHRTLGPGLHGIHIVPDGIQVDYQLRRVKSQRISSFIGKFHLFYHILPGK